MQPIECAFCKTSFMPKGLRAKYCSLVCAASNHKGKVSVVGKSARYKKTKGVLEHRAVMERILGRPLVRGETVHHKNGVRQDNHPDNLELWYRAQPAGQRVDDLIQYIVTHHRSKLQRQLSSLLKGQEFSKEAA